MRGKHLPKRTGRLATFIAIAVLAVFSVDSRTVANANAHLKVEISKLPEPWSKANCRTSTVAAAPAAFAVFGRLIAPRRWNHIVLAVAETAPADREVSESEAKNSTIIQIGPDRTRARLQVFAGLAALDWWKDGVRVSIVAAGRDRNAAVAVARKVAVVANGSTVSLRVSPVPSRVLIARATISKSGLERLTCETGPGGRAFDIESGDGFDPGAPPAFAGDELVKFTVGANPAWRTSRTVKFGAPGAEVESTTCLLSAKLSANTRATLRGPAPCDGLAADAASLFAALR